MRVITGSARGRKLTTLEGNDVRPTGDKIKEAVFSSIQFNIEGRNFLDLFSGSGQMGIEALSRGARFATFVDSASNSIAMTKQNIDTTGFTDISEVKKSDCFSFLTNTDKVFDIAFLDPPYHKDILKKVLPLTAEVMSNNGIIICEHPFDVELPKNVGCFTLKKQHRYGKILISIYKKGSD